MKQDYGLGDDFFFRRRKDFRRVCREILKNPDVRSGMLLGLAAGYHSVELPVGFGETVNPIVIPYLVACCLKRDRRYAISDAMEPGTPRTMEALPTCSSVLFGELQAFEPAPRPARGARFETLRGYRVYFPHDKACFPQVEIGNLWYYFDIRRELDWDISWSKARGIIGYNFKRVLQIEREIEERYATVRSGAVQLLTKPVAEGEGTPRCFSRKDRMAVFLRDGLKCVICGRSAEDGAVLEVDHVIPVSNGGRTSTLNGRTLCRDCNVGVYYSDHPSTSQISN